MTNIQFLSDKSKLGTISQQIFSSYYPKNEDILIKIHFGEPGNLTALTPNDVAPIIKSLKSLGLRPTFIDTTVNYNSPRHTVAGYSQVVKDRGFDQLAPFIISDNFIDIKTKNLTSHVCRELVEAKNLLVISHVKGHPCSGFGGAIKNFGMGGVSKDTKSDIHNLSKPIFNSSTCTGCGVCARLCPAGAITIKDNHPQVDLDRCMGCSICEINCPTKSLTPKVATFDDLLAQGAASCINHLPKNSYYINFIQNITQHCDCAQNSGKILAPDMGILFSDNPVAIDRASLDLIKKNVGQDVFQSANHKDPLLHLNYASEYTSLDQSYQI